MALDARQALIDIFPNADSATIDLLLTKAEVKDYPAQTILAQEGRIEDTFYIILDGRVDIFRTIEGHTFVLDYQETGSSFGEIALILDIPRTADVVTTQDSKMLEINRSAFDETIRQNADALLRVMQLIMRRILTQQERRLTELVRKEIGE